MSRIGTLFFRTPGLVTKKGVHAMQRLMWIEAVNADRAAAGMPELTMAEEEAEIAESVDLIFTDDQVLIRPNPDRMDLALRADETLQQMVSKRAIRFLNTNSAKVRAALRERGENWRMARQPISQEDMAELILKSRVPVGERPIYYYNHTTGTRYVTAGTYEEIANLPPDAFRRQIAEVVTGLNKRNRTGHPEVDLFPSSTPIEIKTAFKTLKADNRPFGTNDEETYCCGEGAAVLDRLHPELVKALAEYVAARADDPKKDRIVVLSAYTKKALRKYGKLNAVTMEELAASCL